MIKFLSVKPITNFFWKFACQAIFLFSLSSMKTELRKYGFVDKKKMETILIRSILQYFILYFTWSPYILTVARISFPNFKFFEKFVEDLFRVSNIVVKSSSSTGICLKKENLYIVDNFFWMLIVFPPKT